MENNALETIEVLEPILFTNLSERLAGNAKPSEFIKLMKFIAIDYSLDIRKQYHFDICKKIIINSIRYN